MQRALAGPRKCKRAWTGHPHVHAHEGIFSRLVLQGPKRRFSCPPGSFLGLRRHRKRERGREVARRWEARGPSMRSAPLHIGARCPELRTTGEEGAARVPGGAECVPDHEDVAEEELATEASKTTPATAWPGGARCRERCSPEPRRGSGARRPTSAAGERRAREGEAREGG